MTALTQVTRPLRSAVRGASPMARIPALLVGGFVLLAVLGPLLVPYDPTATHVGDRLLAPGATTHAGHTAWLGTDALGRDMLAQLVHGARTSLVVGTATAVVAGVFGVLCGLVAGYARGLVDAVVMRLIDIQLAFPGILLAIVISGVMGRSFTTVVVALAVTRWIAFARVVRGSTLSLREREWVAAARLLGLPRRAVLLRHVLPFVAGPVMALATLEFGLIVLSEAGLSFLGIGLPNSAVSWGQTIALGKEYLATAWWISAFPGLALALLVIGVGLLGDQLTHRFGSARRTG
ncbi:ABC transporter permease [Streptomyces sp. NPDC102462]|uniref:ABC transporter permease n=1 Tax=Streptomyces sp. NPDC102462 TaxID=3366178 RepID=UPI003801029F